MQYNAMTHNKVAKYFKFIKKNKIKKYEPEIFT
jgi:hypothetical protein